MYPTQVQAEVLRIVARWQEENEGRSPSLREIADQRRRGSPRNGVVQALRYLEAKKFLRRRGPRNIEILDRGKAFMHEDIPW